MLGFIMCERGPTVTSNETAELENRDPEFALMLAVEAMRKQRPDPADFEEEKIPRGYN